MNRLRVAFTSDRSRPLRWEQLCINAVLAVPQVEQVGFFRFPVSGIAPPPALHARLQQRLRKRSAWQEAEASGITFNEAPSLPPVVDVIIHFGTQELPVAWIDAAAQGVWSIGDACGVSLNVSQAAAAAWVNGERTFPIAVRRRTRQHTDIILERTYPLPSFGAADALSAILLHAAEAPAEGCSMLVRGDSLSGSSLADVPVPSLTFRASLRTLIKDDVPLLDRPRRTAPLIWNIGLAQHSIEHCLDKAPYNVRWLPPPGEGASRMNPAAYMHGDRLNVLYAKEDEEGRSVIARLRPKSDQLLKRSRTMLSGPGDHVHPFTLVNEGSIFVVLGAPGNKGVQLYRIPPQNDTLEPIAQLCDHPLHHATLFEHAGGWWLMGTLDLFPEAALQVLHAERMSGPYTAVMQGPVKVDVRSAKPAGTPFIHAGALYRPAQDLTEPERPQVVMMRITELTPHRFREEIAFHVPPPGGSNWDHAISTLSSVAGQLVIGGARRPPGTPASHRRSHRSFDDE